MPCYTMTTVTVELNNANLDILKAALLKSFGINAYQVGQNRIAWSDGREWYDKSTGQLTVRNASQVNPIKQAYGIACVSAMATKMRWQATRKANNKFIVKKGY